MNDINNYLKEKIKIQLELAKKIEPLVTSFLEKTARNNGGVLHGLEYKFKTLPSALRKINDIIADENVENKFEKNYLDQKVSGLKDYLRYTVVLKEENFTENVEKIIKELKNNDYKLNDLKNRFKNDAIYKDINSHYFNDEVFKFHFYLNYNFIQRLV